MEILSGNCGGEGTLCVLLGEPVNWLVY